MIVPPAAYEKAATGRQNLLSRFDECCSRLKQNGRNGTLRSFQSVMARGVAAINMSVARTASFIKDGGYLNIYEFVGQQTGLTGKRLERTVSTRLKELGPLRLKLDQLFHFQHDTHYASFNLGGAGARRYGFCCVTFDLRHWEPHHTCFAGDSIRACSGADKQAVLSDEEILVRFAIGEDLVRLATVRWESFLDGQEHCIDPGEARALVEAEDSLLEVHLHGPVKREHIHEVRLSRADYRHLCDLARRAEGLTSPLPWEFDNVEPFRRLLDLLDQFDIPLVLAEE